MPSLATENLPVILLMGPTGAGKTDLAVELTELLPVEVISVDSAMVYRGLDIGSGKPDAATLMRAPHRLIDIRDPEHVYSAAEFVADAEREIADIRSKGRVPLLVGGTGLYFRALTRGLSALPSADAKVRSRLSGQAAQLGWQALHERLQAIDPTAASRIHRNDPQRIQRALEVYELTGVPLSEQQGENRQSPLVEDAFSLVVTPTERTQLHDRIQTRFDSMLERGLVTEVEQLYARPSVHRSLPAMRSVGYRQVIEFLEQECSFDEMREHAIAATRQLARRQLTWLRAQPSVVWLETGAELVAKSLTRIEDVIRTGRV